MSVRSVLDSRHTYIMVSEVETLPLVCYGAHIDRIWIPCCWVGAMHKVPGTQVSYVCLYMYTRSLEHKHIGILEFMTHTFVPRNHELDAEHPCCFRLLHARIYAPNGLKQKHNNNERKKEKEKKKKKKKTKPIKKKKRGIRWLCMARHWLRLIANGGLCVQLRPPYPCFPLRIR